MRTRSLFVSSIMGVALLGLAGSASAAPTQITATNTYDDVDPLEPYTINVSCPTTPAGGGSYSHHLLVGGGFEASHDFSIYENRMVGSTWQVSVFNAGSSVDEITVYANCLYWNGNPTKPTIVHETSSMTTVPVSTTPKSVTSPSCPTDSTDKAKKQKTIVVSGGYLTSEYTGPYVPTYIKNGRSSNAWQVTGYNPAGSPQQLQTQVNCLNGWSVVNSKKQTVWATSSQAQGQDSEEGIAQASCTASGAVASGGGWSISQGNLNFPYQCLSFGPTDYTCDMDYASSSLAYAECLVAP